MSYHHRGDHDFLYFTMHTNILHVFFALNCRFWDHEKPEWKILPGSCHNLVQVCGEKVQDSKFVGYSGNGVGVTVICPWNEPEGGQFRIRFGEKGA